MAHIHQSVTPIIIITGLSGAGHTTALKILEDFGYDVVDNLPLSLFDQLVHLNNDFHQPLAVGIDVRTYGFLPEKLIEHRRTLGERTDIKPYLVFLDCDDQVLYRRFNATRRRHPYRADRPVLQSIAAERQFLGSLKQAADLVINTSGFTPNDLKRVLHGHFPLEEEKKLHLSIISFSYQQGLPNEADIVWDARFLQNPFYDSDLKPLSGKDQKVANFIHQDPNYAVFQKNVTHFLTSLLDAYAQSGKSYLTLAFGCTGGQHRSVLLAEECAQFLQTQGFQADVIHRDLR